MLCVCPVCPVGRSVLSPGGRRLVLRGIRGPICWLSNAATCKDVHGYPGVAVSLWPCPLKFIARDREDCDSSCVRCFQMSDLYGDGKHLGL